MKKLLVLGAMQMHIPLLKRAKERGCYLITCDYIKENEGHLLADEAYYDSTTDIESVYRIALQNNVEGVLTFNSDPAALTASIVSAKLGLPCSSPDSVRIMSEKDLFRDFLLRNGFNVPKFATVTNDKDILSIVDNFAFPLIIKPVDSSGSKGVTKVDSLDELLSAYFRANAMSRSKRVIVEEFIEPMYNQLHGDAFVLDGKLSFIYLGDHHFDNKINGLVPYSTTFPSTLSEDMIMRVEQEVSRFISLVGFKQGGINIEARISKTDGKIYLIEVGPRNGGNFTPIVIQYASNFNFIDATLDLFLKGDVSLQHVDKKGYFAYLILHSEREGVLKKIVIDPLLEEKILEKHLYLREGGIVNSFKGANAAIGVLLVQFSSEQEMNNIVTNFENYYTVILEA